jgi:hypothetical protein
MVKWKLGELQWKGFNVEKVIQVDTILCFMSVEVLSLYQGAVAAHLHACIIPGRPCHDNNML